MWNYDYDLVPISGIETFKHNDVSGECGDNRNLGENIVIKYTWAFNLFLASQGPEKPNPL